MVYCLGSEDSKGSLFRNVAGPARISAIWTKFDFSEIELESLNARNTYPNALKFLIFWLVPIEIII